METERIRIGKLGEELARKHLRQKGYKILDINYKTRYSEIDFIARKSNTIVFVEVRTKVGEQFGRPEETLRPQKLRKILFNARSFMGFRKLKNPCRIDAVCIVLNFDKTLRRIAHYENIVF
ncbi:MAG: YraN family protein [Candidatus Wildermuthbacteria bacterium]|nr:YraN family protein [Candidatus Wildermuthbacteria bacterium]